VHVPDLEDVDQDDMQKSMPARDIDDAAINSGVRRFLYELLDNQETFTRDQIID
jgi:hypothetical protein